MEPVYHASRYQNESYILGEAIHDIPPSTSVQGEGIVELLRKSYQAEEKEHNQRRSKEKDAQHAKCAEMASQVSYKFLTPDVDFEKESGAPFVSRSGRIAVTEEELTQICKNQAVTTRREIVLKDAEGKTRVIFKNAQLQQAITDAGLNATLCQPVAVRAGFEKLLVFFQVRKPICEAVDSFLIHYNGSAAVPDYWILSGNMSRALERKYEARIQENKAMEEKIQRLLERLTQLLEKKQELDKQGSTPEFFTWPSLLAKAPTKTPDSVSSSSPIAATDQETAESTDATSATSTASTATAASTDGTVSIESTAGATSMDGTGAIDATASTASSASSASSEDHKRAQLQTLKLTPLEYETTLETHITKCKEALEECRAFETKATEAIAGLRDITFHQLSTEGLEEMERVFDLSIKSNLKSTFIQGIYGFVFELKSLKLLTSWEFQGSVEHADWVDPHTFMTFEDSSFCFWSIDNGTRLRRLLTRVEKSKTKADRPDRPVRPDRALALRDGVVFYDSNVVENKIHGWFAPFAKSTVEGARFKFDCETSQPPKKQEAVEIGEEIHTDSILNMLQLKEITIVLSTAEEEKMKVETEALQLEKQAELYKTSENQVFAILFEPGEMWESIASAAPVSAHCELW